MSALHRVRRPRNRAFTLVELAIVVAIVGVLAVIAIVSYRKYMLNAKITEARSMIGAIRIAQESHKSEKGTYANIGTGTWCPTNAGFGSVKAGWNTTCSGGTAAWQVLPVHTDGPVSFQYMTTAGSAGLPTALGPILPAVDYSAGRPGPWYVVGATCDLDDDPALDTKLTGSSLDNIIRTQNDGS